MGWVFPSLFHLPPLRVDVLVDLVRVLAHGRRLYLGGDAGSSLWPSSGIGSESFREVRLGGQCRSLSQFTRSGVACGLSSGTINTPVANALVIR